ncbi:MAG: hypothetical protein KA175_10495 [Flavobacteriales bacterium]|nr:hypothetical protein [Flavobacteriales bacterium]MBP6698038.1 hypothetical protein [Flavobacteriales bacterium]
MKNTGLLATALVGCTLLVLGCGTDTPAHSDHPDQGTAAAQTTDAPESDVPAVRLDSLGNRWIANPETTTGIANMSAILQAFDPASGNADTLKAALEEEFGLIFERCTMEGEAHEQLHNYLIPIHHMFRGPDGLTAHLREELAAHLASYETYFQ